MIGTRRGHYRLVEKLGEGGMGVVYKAYDEKLARVVAVKFLPREAATHAAERDRLLQEARAASALNHPNICVVHAIEEHDGEPYIVMEWVEGETLRARIARAPVPLDQAVAWAIQIGDALREAHARGVIHRDVKTENVMLTAQGQAKVMDFGLAKLKGLGQATSTTSTQGTLAYMAPEQIREGRSDARSDIYAFGVVLYELLTGVQPFRGDQQAAVMYAILNTEPEPLQQRRPSLSPAWQHVVGRALEKGANDRYQSIDEMTIELRRMQRDLANTRGAVTAAGGLAEPAPPPRPSGSRRAFLAGLALMAIGLAFAGWLTFQSGPPRLNPGMTFRTLPVPAKDIAYPGMSRDGQWVAFPADDGHGRWDLYFMNVNGTGARRITSDSSVAILYLDTSPDGSDLAYSSVDAPGGLPAVKVVSSLGGSSRIVAPAGDACRWSPDGQRIGYLLTAEFTPSRQLEFWSVRPDGSDRRLEYRDTLCAAGGVEGSISFAWSPDGRSIAWLRSFRDRTQELFLIPLHGGRERQLTHDGKNIDEVCWTRQNDLIFSSNRAGNTNLWIMRASAGPAVQITRGAGPDLGMRVSDDGRTLLYLQTEPVDRLWVQRLDRTDPHPVPLEADQLGRPSLSPDGSEIAVPVYEGDALRPRSHLVRLRRDGSGRTELTFGDESVSQVEWAPKGHRLCFTAVPGGQPGDSARIYVVDPAFGSGSRLVGYGSAGHWVDSNSVVTVRRMRMFRIGVDDGKEQQVGTDSVWTIPFPKRDYELVSDFRVGGANLSMRRRAHDGTLTTRPIPGPGDPNILFAHDGTRFLRNSPHGAELVTLPDLRATRLPRFPPFIPGDANLSWDGREIVYKQHRYTSKLVLIEHLR